MPPFLTTKNRQILVNQDAVRIEETYLIADISAASPTLTVANINRFAINQNLIINPYGETAERVKTHASSAPSGTTVTLSANTAFAHYAGEKVYLVTYNQIELSRALTITGAKTALSTSLGNGLVDMEADNKILKFVEREYNSGYYFGRYINGIGATFTISGDTLTSTAHGLVNGDTLKLIAATTMPTGLSSTVVYYVVSAATNTFKVSLTNGGTAITASDSGTGTLTWYKSSLFSDPLIVSGWTRDSVGFMIDRSLRDLEIELSDKVTREDCYEWLNSGIKESQGKLKRWPEHYSYNAVLGQVSRGNNIVAMPTDAYDRETNKSLIAVRIGDNSKLSYLDPVSFDQQMEGVKVTQVTTQATSGQTTLEINNSYDFEDSGSVNVYIAGVKYNIIYTGVTRSATAGILTGIASSGTGSITVTIPADTYVWQGEMEGVPSTFTVRNSNIEFYPLADGNNDNANLYSDYSKVAVMVDSDGDVIDYQRYDMLQDYLTWRMKMKDRNKGELDRNDGYYLGYKEKLNDAIRTLAQNNKFPMRPRVNNMSKRPRNRWMSLQDIHINDQ